MVYCWGVLTLYIVSWGIFDPAHTRFADRVAYALMWPLRPIQAPFAVLYMFLVGVGTISQRAEAATRLLDLQKKQPTKTPGDPTTGGGYVQ